MPYELPWFSGGGAAFGALARLVAVKTRNASSSAHARFANY